MLHRLDRLHTEPPLCRPREVPKLQSVGFRVHLSGSGPYGPSAKARADPYAPGATSIVARIASLGMSISPSVTTMCDELVTQSSYLPSSRLASRSRGLIR